MKKAFEQAGVAMPEPIFIVRQENSSTDAPDPTAGAEPRAVTEESLRPDTDLQRQAERWAGGEDQLDVRAAQE